MKRPILTLLVLALALTGCRPAVLYVGDPAQLASLPDPEEFENALRREVRRTGHTLESVWFSGAQLSEIVVEEAIGATDASIVALSPYLTPLVRTLAGVFPDKRFIALYSSPDSYGAAESIVHVQFVRRDSMEELGRAVSSWVAAEPRRNASLLAVTGQSPGREESAWFLSSFTEATDAPIEIVEFDRPPGREVVRATIERLDTSANAIVTLLLASSTGLALEFLRDEPASLALRAAVGQDTPLPVRFFVHEDLPAAIASALESPTDLIVVESELVVLPEEE